MRQASAGCMVSAFRCQADGDVSLWTQGHSAPRAKNSNHAKPRNVPVRHLHLVSSALLQMHHLSGPSREERQRSLLPLPSHLVQIQLPTRQRSPATPPSPQQVRFMLVFSIVLNQATSKVSNQNNRTWTNRMLLQKGVNPMGVFFRLNGAGTIHQDAARLNNAAQHI